MCLIVTPIDVNKKSRIGYKVYYKEGLRFDCYSKDDKKAFVGEFNNVAYFLGKRYKAKKLPFLKISNMAPKSIKENRAGFHVFLEKPDLYSVDPDKAVVLVSFSRPILYGESIYFYNAKTVLVEEIKLLKKVK